MDIFSVIYENHNFIESGFFCLGTRCVFCVKSSYFGGLRPRRTWGSKVPGCAGSDVCLCGTGFSCDYIWDKLMRCIHFRPALCSTFNFNHVAEEKNNLTTAATWFRKPRVSWLESKSMLTPPITEFWSSTSLIFSHGQWHEQGSVSLRFIQLLYPCY